VAGTASSDRTASSVGAAGTGRAAPGSVAGLVALRATDDGQRPAFIGGSDRAVVTWLDIAASSAGWDRLIPRDRPVGLSICSPTIFCENFLAALAAGVPVVPLDPRATPDEHARVIDRLQLADVLVDSEDSQLLVLGDPGLSLWRTRPAGPSAMTKVRHLAAGRRRSSPARRADEAVILTTSGSTGRPKVVPLSESQLLHVARAIAGHHELTPNDRGYSPLPLFHVNALVVGVLATLFSGGSLVVDDRFHRSSCWGVVEENDVSWLNLVPAIISRLADTPPRPESVARVRFARSASAPLPLAVLERFESATGIGVIETYGMTEAASQIAASPLDPRQRRPGSVGRPVAAGLRVVDESRRPLPQERVGEIEVAGDGVVRHYIDEALRPVPARAADGWLPTGDLGWVGRDGLVRLVGRADEVINRGGEKLYPREVEEVLRTVPLVAEAAVVGRDHPELGSEPVAFVATVAGADRSRLVADLAEACRRSLSRYKQPAEIHVVDHVPAGPTGKVSHRRVAAELLGVGDAAGERG
jgi:acyl-CoA synthetase (AMP-forming)/AMP-acid ligase II